MLLGQYYVPCVTPIVEIGENYNRTNFCANVATWLFGILLCKIFCIIYINMFILFRSVFYIFYWPRFLLCIVILFKPSVCLERFSRFSLPILLWAAHCVKLLFFILTWHLRTILRKKSRQIDRQIYKKIQKSSFFLFEERNYYELE